MTCAHASIQEPRTGAESTCILCGLEIMFDGLRWVWTFGIDQHKRRKYATVFADDQANRDTR